MKYINILTSIILLGLSVSAFAQDEVVQNAKITDIYPAENTSVNSGFFKQASTLGLMPSYTIGGEEYPDPERNFSPSFRLSYAGDLNGDGYDDFYYRVTTADETTEDLDDQVTKTVVLYGSPNGIDAANSLLVRDGYTFLTDLTGDGQPESIQYIDGILYLVIDESNGELEELVDVNLITLNYFGEYRAHGDFNGDGFEDLMVYNNTVNPQDTTDNYIIYGAADVANIAIDTLRMTTSGIGSFTEYFQMAYSDINGDGTTEIVKVMSGTNLDNVVYESFSIYHLNGSGEMEQVSQDTVWGQFSRSFTMRNGTIGLADMNGDGSKELHVSNDGIFNVYQLSADTTLSFDTDNPIATDSVNNFSILNDFDDDGQKELMLYSQESVVYRTSDANFNFTETNLPMQDGDYIYPVTSNTENINSGET